MMIGDRRDACCPCRVCGAPRQEELTALVPCRTWVVDRCCVAQVRSLYRELGEAHDRYAAAMAMFSKTH